MRKPTRRRLNKQQGSCGGGRNSKAATLPAKQEAVMTGDRGGGGVDPFDCLPDDLVLAVLAGLAARAGCPADLAAAALPCRRFRDLAAHPAVLSRASAAAVAVPATRWSDAAHRFLRQCAAAGNLHACYFLGMVRFYCCVAGSGSSRATGAALLASAAAGGHAPATYALAVVRFNGSGGDKAADIKDPRAGVALCARAACLGHLPALRELGHCLQDGYGARRDAAAGRHLLLHANGEEEDAARRFMVDWWALAAASKKGEQGDGGDVRLLCSHPRCGRRETRRHEFRRCSACGSAIYCSRACQALDWRRVHRRQCAASAAAGNAQ